MRSEMPSVKMCFGGEVGRFALQQQGQENENDFTRLACKPHQRFHKHTPSRSPLAVVHVDEGGERVVVASSDELREALRVAHAQGRTTARFELELERPRSRGALSGQECSFLLDLLTSALRDPQLNGQVAELLQGQGTSTPARTLAAGTSSGQKRGGSENTVDAAAPSCAPVSQAVLPSDESTTTIASAVQTQAPASISSDLSDPSAPSGPSDPSCPPTPAVHPVFSVEQISAYTRGVLSSDPEAQFSCTKHFRQLLSESNAPIQQVIDAGVVPALVSFLMRDENPSLQYEAAWALTNITSGTTAHTQVVIEAHAVPLFIRLLSSTDEDIRNQAAWAIGNLAGDSAEYRDFALSHGALPALIACFTEESCPVTVRTATWALSNLFRGKPAPDMSVVQSALPMFHRLTMSNDTEVVSNACWALAHISGESGMHIQAVIDTGVCARLVELLYHPATAVHVPALRTVGNIVTGNSKQTQAIIDLKALSAVLWLLDHFEQDTKKEVCWLISNITSGSSAQIQSVIEAGFIPRLIRLLQTAELDTQKRAAWALNNATAGGTSDQIMYMVQQGAVKTLCDLLFVNDSQTVRIALETIKNILKAGRARASAMRKSNAVASEVTRAAGLQKRQGVQDHPCDAIFYKAVEITEAYFDTEAFLHGLEASRPGRDC